MMDAPVRLAVLALALGCAGCTRDVPVLVLPPRDWSADPAILEREAVPLLYAVSDVHGSFDRLAQLLTVAQVIRAVPSEPSAVEWTAGGATLLVLGDLYDKGSQSLKSADLVRAMESAAAQAGGEVIALLGNHEAEFLANPENDKAIAKDGVSTELEKLGLVPFEFATSDDPRAVWLRRRPFAARVGTWFFAHAGNTKGLSLMELTSRIQSAVDRSGYGDPEIIGNDSLLEARAWYEEDATLGERYAAQVSAEHIVFGHDPNAIGMRGEIGQDQRAALFRIDCGMAPSIDDSQGKVMRVRREGAMEIADSLAIDGSSLVLWRSE